MRNAAVDRRVGISNQITAGNAHVCDDYPIEISSSKDEREIEGKCVCLGRKIVLTDVHKKRFKEGVRT